MTWHLHIEGQVQGVGFRPFVFLLAREFMLSGWVNNTTDGVHIQFNASKDLAQQFHATLLEKAPAIATITHHELRSIPLKEFEGFQILHSQSTEKTSVLLTPDLAMCLNCQKEVYDKKDRRYAYPFITCTHCGPRYSITPKLPYDRVNTTMAPFKMCTTCREEYDNPMDRRYFSQTNSCPDCRIELSLYNNQEELLNGDQDKIIDYVVDAWLRGKIVAIKGIGGYLLTCDAANSDSIQELRKRKHRPSKPFALMAPDTDNIHNFSTLHPEGEKLLNGPVSPILLLDLQREGNSSLSMKDIAPGLAQVGVMIPYTPLFEILLHQFGQPIVATSGNVSNAPIVFEDEKAISGLPSIADLILVNNRDISLPQDDSVVKFSTSHKQKIIFRRSRGLAPTYVNALIKLPPKSILATGAMLKSTFTLSHQENIYVSQYLGDQEHFDTQKSYEHTVQHFLQLFGAAPEVILLDKHPEYPTTQYGQNLAQSLNIPTVSFQHHIAHFGAVLGENNLIDSQTPILGVIWDGTGLGEDRQIWGGEFFKYEHYNFLRCYYFDYFDFILGDKMPKEPRVSALSACWDVMGAEEYVKHKFTNTEWAIYTKLLNKENTLQTSSVGRLFDAVASLLDLMDVQTYEGEAAMRLETLARGYFNRNGLDRIDSYFKEGAHYYRVPTKTLIMNLVMDLKKGLSREFIAAKFHFSLVQLIRIIANHLKIKQIAFSGGVFQNSLLVDLIIEHLREDYELHFHQQLSPNDENISFGQLICYRIQQRRSSENTSEKNKIKNHVFSDSREDQIYRDQV